MVNDRSKTAKITQGDITQQHIAKCRCVLAKRTAKRLREMYHTLKLHQQKLTKLALIVTTHAKQRNFLYKTSPHECQYNHLLMNHMHVLYCSQFVYF